MKRILTIILGLTLAVGLSAQTKTATLSRTDHVANFSGRFTNLDASTDATKLVYDIQDKSVLQYYALTLDLDTLDRTAVDSTEYIRTLLQGSWDGINYSNIDTVDFYCTEDTVFSLSDVSTGTAYPFLRLNVAGSDSVGAVVDKSFGRFLDK